VSEIETTVSDHSMPNEPTIFYMVGESLGGWARYHVRADMVPGKTTRLRLVPDKTGTFVFLCDVFCGTGHEEMNGKLVVSD